MVAPHFPSCTGVDADADMLNEATRLAARRTLATSLDDSSAAPVHDDLIADLQCPTLKPWLSDITEHPTGEGKLYLWPPSTHGCPSNIEQTGVGGVVGSEAEAVPENAKD